MCRSRKRLGVVEGGSKYLEEEVEKASARTFLVWPELARCGVK
jgi:hypothetical protein